jgi:hypothetical protein
MGPAAGWRRCCFTNAPARAVCALGLLCASALCEASAMSPPPATHAAPDLKEALEWLAKAKSAAYGMKHPQGQADLFCRIAECQARGRDVGTAMQTVGEAINIFSANSGRDGLLSRGPLARTGRYFDDPREFPPGPRDAYSAVAAAQVAAGDLAGALRTAAGSATGAVSAVDPTVRWVAYGGIVSEQVRAGNAAGAKATADRITDPVGKLRTYCTIAMGQTRAGDAAGARETRESVKGSTSGILDLNARCGVLSCLLLSQAVAADVAAVGDTIAEIKRTCDVDNPNALYWYLVAAQAWAGDVASALANVEKMDRDSGIRGGAYGNIVRAQLRKGDVNGARQSLAAYRVMSRPMNALDVAFDNLTIARGLIRQGNVAVARQVIAAAKPVILTSDDEFGYARKLGVPDLACLQAVLGDVADASATLAHIVAKDAETEEKRSEVCAYIARAQATSGDFAGARATASRISTPAWQQLALWALAKEQAGKDAGAISELRRWIGTLADPGGRAHACLGVAEGLLPAENILELPQAPLVTYTPQAIPAPAKSVPEFR